MTQYSCITFLHVKLLQTVIIRSRQKSIYLVIKPCTRASAFHRQSAALRSRWRRILLNAFTYFTAHLRAPRLLFSSKPSVISVFLRTNETLKLEPFSMPRALLSSQFINVCLFNFPIHKDFFFILSQMNYSAQRRSGSPGLREHSHAAHAACTLTPPHVVCSSLSFRHGRDCRNEYGNILSMEEGILHGPRKNTF